MLSPLSYSHCNMPFVLDVRLWILFFLCSFLPSLPTCLELPLSEIWQERQAGFTPRSGFSKSLVKDFFTYDTSQGYLRRRLHQENLKSPNLCASFFKAHSQHKILFKLFFVRHCFPTPSHPLEPPFEPPDLRVYRDAIVLLPKYELYKLTSQQFRRILSARLPVLPFRPVWTHSRWISFWASPIHHSSRSIWYCALHSKLSCRLVLHQIVPVLFPDTVCSICLTSEDHPAHFLFLCPNKLSVWQEMWQSCFGFSCRI
ncbi:hypothetical protein BDF14DRAFT_1768027 [Spinellus fusiger]|nr:hypothetical protein BDF14DRAFT_1768027 [Spinellus fusiger]